MNFFKKAGACIAAAALMLTTAVSAGAAETKLELLTASYSDLSVDRLSSIMYDGYYAFEKDGSTVFFRIGEAELDEWRKTGQLTPTSIECGLDLSGFSWWSGDFSGGYAQYAKRGSDGNVTERTVVHIDKDNGKIEEAYKLGTEWSYTTPDGYTVLNSRQNVEDATVTIPVMKPDGTIFNTTLKSWVAHMDGAEWDDYVWVTYMAVVSEKYCCYVVVDEEPDGEILDERIYDVYAISKDGSADKIIDGLNAFSFRNIEQAGNETLVLSIIDTHGPIHVAFSADGKELCRYEWYGSVSYVDNDVAVAKNTYGQDGDYCLIDLKSGESVAEYSYISSCEDDMFFVGTKDGKWGYIDKSGKELAAVFDDAASFTGGYAPVLSNGKAYLIDKNMKRVSNKINATGVGATADSDLYLVFTDDDQILLGTYTMSSGTEEPGESADTPDTSTSDPTETSDPSGLDTSEPAEPADTSDASKPEAPDNKNPDTGIGAAFVPIAALGAVIFAVSRKRK